MHELKAKEFLGVYLPGAVLSHFVPQEKCTFKHILDRCEAGGRENFQLYPYRLKSWVLMNRPFGLYIHIGAHLLKYMVGRITRRNVLSRYIKLRVLIAVTEGYSSSLQDASIE